MTSARTSIAAAAAAIVLAAPVAGQAPAVFAPIDVRVPVAPHPFAAGGATHLVYELHVTNLAARTLTLESVDVLARSTPGTPRLLHLEGDALDAAIKRLGAGSDAIRRELSGGGTAIVFVWATIAAGATPAMLTHAIAVRAAGTDAPAIVVRGVDVAVPAAAPRVIGPPLEGDHWLAANGPGNAPDHRRTLMALAGEARIAQRFAIDWVRLFDEGRTFRGNPRDNASYRAFGARALAVADGIVVETLDGIPENVPDAVVRAVPITPATISGNSVLLDLGGEVYAVYAHLQPGSLRVRKGDRVRRGQVLALVGNTGNSSEPHLHFHLSDRARALDAEGLPYAFRAFVLEADPGVITASLRPAGDSLEIGPTGLAAWQSGARRRREREIPLLDAIVTFVDR